MIPVDLNFKIMTDNQYTFAEIFPLVATWQGHVSYTMFSIYAVNPEIFLYYLGSDPGPFLFSNMIYGNCVHIYTRPAMKRLKTSFRVMYSIYGTYAFNFSSMLLFFSLGQAYRERILFVSILSYFVGKILYSMFYSYLYFVDKLSNPLSRRGDSVLEFIFEN